MVEFILGAAFGGIVVSLLVIDGLRDLEDAMAYLKLITTTCRPSKRTGKINLEQARIFLEEQGVL